MIKGVNTGDTMIINEEISQILVDFDLRGSADWWQITDYKSPEQLHCFLA